MNERSSPRHEFPQKQTRCKKPWEWRDSESKFTTHICRSSNSAPLFIELSRQQLLTKICQVSALFNFSPNALQHGSLSCQDWSGHLLYSILALFVHLSCLKCVLSHFHFFLCSHLCNGVTPECAAQSVPPVVSLQFWDVAVVTFSGGNPAVRQKPHTVLARADNFYHYTTGYQRDMRGRRYRLNIEQSGCLCFVIFHSAWYLTQNFPQCLVWQECGQGCSITSYSG